MIKKIIGIMLCIVVLSGCSEKDKEPLTKTVYALGTVITINLYNEGSEELLDTLTKRIVDIEQKMSTSISTSDVSKVNQSAGENWVKVSEGTYEVIKRALYFSKLSEGRFDLTIGPIVNLWGIGTEAANLPNQAAISAALILVDYNKIEINDDEMSIYLPIKGMSIDLGGIAKGYVADELVKILKEKKIKKAMINLGGNIYAYGVKDSGNEWKIAIQNPYDQRNEYFGYIELIDKTVVTSGPYERYFEEDGKIYHHIFDAHTGYPIEGDIVSVTVVSDKSIEADALSTVLYTFSQEDGLKLIESMDGVECIYVDKDNQIVLSSGLKDVFVLTDEGYTIVR